MNEYEKLDPSEMIEYFEDTVLQNILDLEEALSKRGANAQVYSVHVCRYQSNGQEPTVEANVQLKRCKVVKDEKEMD